MASIIEIRGLRKIYRIGTEKVIALNSVDLDIQKGEICCFLGTSGSGKSTLLNMMAGLEKPTKGQIKIKGVRIDKLNEKKLAMFRQEHVGFIFQSYNLIPSYTAIENVAMPLMFKGVSKRRRKKQAAKMLANVNLDDRMKHKPNQMSGGQQQRVGIARAFVTCPEIVFADEPTGNLDSKTTEEIMGIIVGMARDMNQTLVIVTHDVQIAEFSDRVVRIKDGNIESIEIKNDKKKDNEGDLAI